MAPAWTQRRPQTSSCGSRGSAWTGECPDPDEEAPRWVMGNDQAYEELNGLIGEARKLLGWDAGSPPLDAAEYLRACAGH